MTFIFSRISTQILEKKGTVPLLAAIMLDIYIYIVSLDFQTPAQAEKAFGCLGYNTCKERYFPGWREKNLDDSPDLIGIRIKVIPTWLVVSTHLKNMLVKMGIFPK